MFELENTKSIKTLMATSLKLKKDDEKNDIGPNLYKSMIGSLLCLTANFLNIAFSIRVCAGYHVKPKESHLATVKQVIR